MRLPYFMQTTVSAIKRTILRTVMRFLLYMLLFSGTAVPVTIYQANSMNNLAGYGDTDFETNGELYIANQFIKPCHTIFDVGANKGEWTKTILSFCPQATIHVFEPITFVFDILTKSLPTQANIILNNLAISNRIGTVNFTVYDNNLYMTQLSSIYRRNKDIEQSFNLSCHTLMVPTITIDNYCQLNHITHIDYLKIDTEGAELDVLKGAHTYLQQRKIKVIQFEYGQTFLDANITLENIFRYLSDFDYKIYRILPDGLLELPTWDTALENYWYSNYLAILQ